MWINKKKFQELEELVAKQKEDIERLNLTLTHNQYEIKAAREAVSDWRKKFELALLTPEHKADVEAAQKRGEDHFKKKLVAFLMSDVELRAELPKVKLPKKLKK